MRGHWQRLVVNADDLQQISLADLKQTSGTSDWMLSADFMQQLQHMGYVESTVQATSGGAL